MPTLTTPPVLAASAVPGANLALATGQQARAAAWRARTMSAELDRRTGRPLPDSGRERGWAQRNLERYRDDVRYAGAKSADLSDRYEELTEALREIAPATADAVDAAVWGTGK